MIEESVTAVKLKDPSKAEKLFAGWDETMVWSCLQGVMGQILTDDEDEPHSAAACLGSFVFFAGVPNAILLKQRPHECFILVPQNEEWAALIEQQYPSVKRAVRYALRKDTVFDRDHLRSIADSLPEGYEIRRIDAEIYEACRQIPQMNDFVGCFTDREEFMSKGLGYVIMKNGKIVSGASSYTRYHDGIEIEVDTLEQERGKGLAAIVCAVLILECLDRGLYPSWDAQNKISLHLAERLGYRFSHEYSVYSIEE